MVKSKRLYLYETSVFFGPAPESARERQVQCFRRHVAAHEASEHLGCGRSLRLCVRKGARVFVPVALHTCSGAPGRLRPLVGHVRLDVVTEQRGSREVRATLEAVLRSSLCGVLLEKRSAISRSLEGLSNRGNLRKLLQVCLRMFKLIQVRSSVLAFF